MAIQFLRISLIQAFLSALVFSLPLFTPSEAASLPLVTLSQIVTPTGPSCCVSPSPTANRSVSPGQNSRIWDRYNELTVSLEFKAFSGGVQVCAERPANCPPCRLCSRGPSHPPASLCRTSTRNSSTSPTQQGLTRLGYWSRQCRRKTWNISPQWNFSTECVWRSRLSCLLYPHKPELNLPVCIYVSFFCASVSVSFIGNVCSDKLQAKQYTCNVTLRRVRVSIVAVEVNNYYTLWVCVCRVRCPACNVRNMLSLS